MQLNQTELRVTITVDELYDKYKKIDERLRQLAINPDFDPNDNRRHVFGVLRLQVLWTESMLAIMNVIEKELIPNEITESIFAVNPSDRDYYEEFFTIARISFIANFNFQMENFFKTLLKELGVTTMPKGFWNILEEILKRTHIPNANQKRDIIYALAMIRNSYHSNGVHTDPTKSVSINGLLVIHFVQGKRVFVNYEELSVIINAIISIIEEIINSSQVRNITTIIPKLYTP